MRELSVKIVNIAALLAAEAWYLRDPDWEPLITTLGLLGALLGFEIRDYRLRRPDPDEATFLKLLEELPSNGGIYFAAHHHMTQAYPRKNLDDLRNFVFNWRRPERSFVSRSLDIRKQELVKLADEYLTMLANFTIPIDADMEVVPSSRRSGPTASLQGAAGELRVKGESLAACYNEFILFAKRRFRL